MNMMAHNIRMGLFWKITLLSFGLITKILAADKGPMDSFFDPKEDYSTFSGRITDKDDSGHVIKVSSENSNIKFFRAGDPVEFTVARIDNPPCQGFVRSVDGGYFVLYVKNFNPCWGKRDFFRRGSALIFNAPRLLERIKSMGHYRVILLRRKNDFLKQLNSINGFLHNYNQKKLIIALNILHPTDSVTFV